MTVMIRSQLDTTIVIGMWVMVAVAVIGLACSVLTGVFVSWLGAGIGVLITAAITAIGVVLIWIPFGYAYNHYVPVSGTVTQVNSRFISDGQGSTQYFVVWFGSQPYKCDDSRCGGLHKGSKVTLLCEKEFQFNAPSQGYVCNWGMLGLNVR